MKKCKKCNLEILDNTHICPLCKGVLEDHKDDIHESMYPDIEFGIDKYKKIKKIILFFLSVVSVILIFINYMTFSGFWWCIIADIGIVYFAITMSYSIFNNRSNLAAKLFVQTLTAAVLVVVIDNVVGYRAWSVNYVIPGLIIFADLSMVLCMIINRMNWQTYFMYQIGITLLSFIPLIMIGVKIVSKPLISVITTVVSVFVLAGTIVFGDRSVKNELIKRFNT